MKNNKIFFISLIIIMIIVGVVGVSLYSVTEIEGKTKIYYSPDFVQLDCTVVDAGKTEVTNSFKYKEDDYNVIKCDDFTKSCDTKLVAHPDVKDLTTFCSSSIEIIQCKADQNIAECERDATGPNTNNLRLIQTGANINLATLDPGEYLIVRAGYTSGFLCGKENKVPAGLLEITKTYDSYGLVVQGDARLVKQEGNCDIPNNIKDNIALEIDGVVSGASREYNKIPEQLTFRQIGDGISYVSYVNEWNPTTRSRVYDYEGKEVYCSGTGDLYEFGEIKVSDGSERSLAPTKYLDTVECCPWMNGCTSDFEWKPEDPASNQCESDLECRGSKFYPSAIKQVSQERCVDNKCVVTETKDVECSTTADCPGGICDIQTWQCKFDLIPDAYCGDKVCDALENDITCPKDCGIPIDNGETEGKTNVGLIIFSILAGLIAALVTGIYVPNGDSKAKTIMKWVLVVVVFVVVFLLAAIIGAWIISAAKAIASWTPFG